LPDALREPLNAHFVGRAMVALLAVKALRKMSIWSIFRLTAG
jgi:hypothetical protein